MTTFLTKDQATVQRPDTSTDPEGNPSGTGGYLAARTVMGTWGTPNGSDVQRAARRDTALDAIFAVPPGTDLQVDDHLTVRGLAYDVVAIVPTRLSLRAHLRSTT
jgi:hypothetical protein